MGQKSVASGARNTVGGTATLHLRSIDSRRFGAKRRTAAAGRLSPVTGRSTGRARLSRVNLFEETCQETEAPAFRAVSPQTSDPTEHVSVAFGLLHNGV